MKRLFLLALIATIVLAIWIPTAPYLATRLIVEKRLENADAILVLSGSSAYKERTRKAAELFKRGIGKQIYITNDGERGSWSQTEQKNPSFAELEERELIANGVVPDAITTLPGIVSGTDQEAKAMAAELDARPIASLLIITSPHHTRRALRTFEKILAGRSVDIGIEHAEIGNHTPLPDSWWFSSNGWQTVAGEYIKSGVYWVLY